MTGALAILRRLGPEGGARVIPVREFLAARAAGDRAVERAFFAGLLMRNGVYKTTEPHRMDDLLPLLVEHAAKVFGERVRILDVGCSSGVTTVELHRAFVQAGVTASTVGTDRNLFADHVARADGAAMLFDTSGALLQVELGSWASPWRWRPRDRVFRPGRVARARRLIDRDGATFLRARTESIPGLAGTRVPLLSSDAVGATDVRFCEEDILAPTLEGTFSLIRAANVLNPGYFAAPTLARMIAALGARLVDGGLLLVVRTVGTPPVHHGTLFRRRGGGFETAARIGDGSEIASLLVPDSGDARIPLR